MTQQAQAEALYLASELENGSFAPNVLQNETGLRKNAAAELRRLHARVHELEMMHDHACLTVDAAEEEIERLSSLVQELGDQQGSAWIRVIDESMVCAHIGVADASDDYATAKDKLNKLICWEIDVAKHFEQEARQAVEMPIDHYDLTRNWEKLYTEKQVRAMVAENPKPLSDEQIKRIDDSTHFHESRDWELRFARAIEKAHGIGVDNAN